jgi:hypothetical protein
MILKLLILGKIDQKLLLRKYSLKRRRKKKIIKITKVKVKNS